jgi:hypothetical protein
MKDVLGRYGDRVNLLGQEIRTGSLNHTTIPRLIIQVIEKDMWRKFNIPSSGRTINNASITFAQFVETQPPIGLGSNIKLIESILIASTKSENQDDVIAANEALEMFASAVTGKLGGDRQSKKAKSSSDNITTASDRGTAKSYAMRRLKKDKPNIYKRVVAGEISAHAGMIEAGFRKKKISCTYDVPSIIKMLKNKFNENELQQIKENI